MIKNTFACVYDPSPAGGRRCRQADEGGSIQRFHSRLVYFNAIGFAMLESHHEKNLILEHPFFNLYHYQSQKQINKTKKPLLIVYALVNRPWILDLMAKRSFIKNLCVAGFDVYLIDWGYPNLQAAKLSLKNYTLDFIDIAVNCILNKHNSRQLNLMGVCQGGVFSLCYAAWKPERIKKLITLVTPVDFHTPENLITPQINLPFIRQWVKELGNFPGATLNWFLTMLKPEHTLINKFQRFLTIKDNPEELSLTLKMEEWIHDTPDHPGQVLIEFIKDFYIENSLMEKEYRLDQEKIIWQNLRMPILNIYAQSDHLVPASAAMALRKILARDHKEYEAVPFEIGHIGLFVSKKTHQAVPAKITDWLLKNTLRNEQVIDFSLTS
jgi:polyhydroxyalkanoate synthase